MPFSTSFFISLKNFFEVRHYFRLRLGQQFWLRRQYHVVPFRKNIFISSEDFSQDPFSPVSFDSFAKFA